MRWGNAYAIYPSKPFLISRCEQRMCYDDYDNVMKNEQRKKFLVYFQNNHSFSLEYFHTASVSASTILCSMYLPISC